MDFLEHIVCPDWEAPSQVHAMMTTRLSALRLDSRLDGGKVHMGMSAPPYAKFNLATHVGDDSVAVAHNRELLRRVLPSEPIWLNQTHGVAVHVPLAGDAAVVDRDGFVPEADAVVVSVPNQVAVIMTADCLPVLFTTRSGGVVAGAHAGWRSLVNGVLERTVDAMCVAGAVRGDILAWLGPAIGPHQFEVGAEVRAQFVSAGCAAGLTCAQVEGCFVPQGAEKFLADIYALARQRLALAGVFSVSGGGLCTVSDAQRFYSYRRDGVTGRMASLVWFSPD